MKLQYELVTSSRMILLDYCKIIKPADLISENSSFGRGSIRNLLVHIGNTYEFWIGKHALNKNISFKEYNTINTLDEVESYFTTINNLISEFIVVIVDSYLEDQIISINDKIIKANPLKLFTHVITHEFHHKGQILSLSRHLGYTPIDTDIIR